MAELCLEESKIDILGRQRADITALADHQRHLPGSGLAADASLRKTCYQQAGHPVDVGSCVDGPAWQTETPSQKSKRASRRCHLATHRATPQKLPP